MRIQSAPHYTTDTNNMKETQKAPPTNKEHHNTISHTWINGKSNNVVVCVYIAKPKRKTIIAEKKEHKKSGKHRHKNVRSVQR